MLGPISTSCCLRSVDGHALPIDELKGLKPVESIDLSKKGLTVASAIIIGACIKGNEHLRQLKYFPRNPNPHARYWAMSQQVATWTVPRLELGFRTHAHTTRTHT